MPQLDASTYSSQIFWLVISLFLLIAVVQGMAAPRLKRILSEREAKSGGDLAAAEAARARAAEHGEMLSKRLAEAHDAARAETARAQAEAAGRSQSALAELGQRLHAKLADAEANLAGRRAQAEAELEGQARDLTAEIVRRFAGSAPAPERIAAALQEAR